MDIHRCQDLPGDIVRGLDGTLSSKPARHANAYMTMATMKPIVLSGSIIFDEQ
jgi:hypothetical protein